MKTFLILLILLSAGWCIADDLTTHSESESPAPSPNQEKIESESSGSYQNIDALFTLYQPYLDNISAYQPTYFLVGTDPAESTFQFSFKYRLFDPDSQLSEKISFINGFHFAYTQTSFWDLATDSLPFEDTSYKPELFFISPNLGNNFSQGQGFFFKTGIQHESNGQGGDDSRNTNFLYAQPIIIDFNSKTAFGILLAPKVWTYVDNDDESNRDLPDYRGYFELELKCGFAESLVVGSNLRWAKEGGSIQLDATFPMHRIINGISGMYLQVQYVNALAESLINYDERIEAFRIGLSIIR